MPKKLRDLEDNPELTNAEQRELAGSICCRPVRDIHGLKAVVLT